MSNLINKAKVALTGEPTTHTTTHQTTNTTNGGVTGTHHNHHLGRDAAIGAGGVGIAEHEHRKHERERAAAYDNGMTTNAGVGMNNGMATTSGTTGGLGPHSSSLMNKLDPRVDSTTGAMKTSSGVTGTTAGTNNYTAGTATGTGMGTHHPHSTIGGNNYTTGTTTGTGMGTHPHSNIGGNNYAAGTAEGVNGPHSSRLANALDPRVDSDADGSTRIGATHATPGRGTAQNTAGPHNSDMMNKLDPRVDSDPNRTTNRTYVGTDTGDHLDAARVPPSVLREHLGHPEITHDYPEYDHQSRHGSVANQDSYRGI